MAGTGIQAVTGLPTQGVCRFGRMVKRGVFFLASFSGLFFWLLLVAFSSVFFCFASANETGQQD